MGSTNQSAMAWKKASVDSGVTGQWTTRLINVLRMGFTKGSSCGLLGTSRLARIHFMLHGYPHVRPLGGMDTGDW